MHITLTGNLGSGKSTICRLLEQNYGYEIFSTGKVIRQIADEMGISVLEMNKLMCQDHKYDKMIDDTSARISRENPDKSILFDSRLAWNFVGTSFKVFLSVDLGVAAERVFADRSRGEVEAYRSVEEARAQLKERAQNEDRRYEEIYQIHYFDFDNYNLVLDSSYAKPEVLAKVLLSEMQNCQDVKQTGRMLISPKRLGRSIAEAEAEGYYPEGTVLLRQDGDGFAVVSGEEVLETAAAKGYPFVQARLQK